jgi:hypothetical protein
METSMKTIIKSLQKTLAILLIISSTAHAEKVCENLRECQKLANQIAKQVQEIKPGCRLVSELAYRNNGLRNVDGLALPSVGHRPLSLSESFHSFYSFTSEGIELVEGNGRLKTEWQVYRNRIPGDVEAAGKILWAEYDAWDKKINAYYDNSENLHCN